jgi:Ras GTPase-activating protein 3
MTKGGSFRRKLAVVFKSSSLVHFQDLQTNRTLTLISKTIQSLGNLVSSRSAQQHAKEEFTVELYKKFCTEKHVEAVKRFLDAISTMDSREVESCGNHEPILLKDG